MSVHVLPPVEVWTGVAVDRPPLSLITGLADDGRMPLEPHRDDHLYEMAEHLFSRQERLSQSEHAEAFALLLKGWPKVPRKTTIELQGEYAGVLKNRGFSRKEIAYVLDLKEDTLRKRRILDFGDTWADEVWRRNDGQVLVGRFPRIVEGRESRSLRALTHDENGGMFDVKVNLPFFDLCRAADPEGRQAGYMRRMREVEARR